MNHPKTNTYSKHYEIGVDEMTTWIISPKPWHPVFATQVDIIILATCDKYNYYFQDIANFLPS